MRYGILSDIHSNIEAFEAVLKTLKKERIDRYAFLGDIIGYGANPRECLTLLKDLIKTPGCLYVAGNHDYAVCRLSSSENFVWYAKTAVEWTRKQLNNMDLEFLSQMRLVQYEENFVIVHANLVAPREWGYIFDINDAYVNFRLQRKQICFIGHSHRPIVYRAEDSVDCFLQEKVNIEDGIQYIINSGSVGQPRDGNPQASVAIYDTDISRVEIRRIHYNVGGAQKKILQAGLPSVLSERLSLGK